MEGGIFSGRLGQCSLRGRQLFQYAVLACRSSQVPLTVARPGRQTSSHDSDKWAFGTPPKAVRAQARHSPIFRYCPAGKVEAAVRGGAPSDRDGAPNSHAAARQRSDILAAQDVGFHCDGLYRSDWRRSTASHP